MDANCKKKRRDRSVSRREERWSMDAQRFEAILTEIRNGYNNIKKNFDQVKVAEILEEIITEYAAAALQAQGAPNFTEVAVLLQHCSELYGKKVDFLYQHVLDVCDSVAAAAASADGGGEGPEEGARGGDKRARRPAASALGGGAWAEPAVTRCAASRRAPDAPRPPPTLPRMYIELEPRELRPHEVPLADYDGEPLGLPADYYAGGRLLRGLLVDELSAAPGGPAPPARPLSLLELQAAIAASAPASPPPDELVPLGASTPLPPRARSPSPPRADSRKRKRRGRSPCERLRLRVTPELRAWLAEARDFRVSGGWVARVVARRAAEVVAARARAGAAAAFRGFELEPRDAGGFAGWSAAEAADAARTELDASALLACDSDDDGFFERSSFTGSESSRREEPAPAPPGRAAAAAEAAAGAWSAGVVARALAAEARGAGADMRRLRARVRGALPPPPGAPLPFAELLSREARAAEDVSQLLLASLVMASAGELEIGRGPPLSLDSFAVRLLPPPSPQRA